LQPKTVNALKLAGLGLAAAAALWCAGRAITAIRERIGARDADAVSVPQNTAPPTAPPPATPSVRAQTPAYLPLIEPYGSVPEYVAGTPAGKLAEKIHGLVRDCKNPVRSRLLATLRVRLDYACMGREDADAVRLLSSQLDELLTGRDPFRNERGNSLRGYFAANDESCQPFSVTLPDEYDPAVPAEAKFPLVIHLHHHGWTDWYRPFQGHPAPSLPGAIVAAPHGRGSCDYMWIAEDDVLAVIDAVSADYPVDTARVYVTGWSMGGTGSLHLPSRWPDRFAAAASQAGNADFTAWEKAWAEDRKRMDTPRSDARMSLRWQTAPVTYAENFLNVAVALDHGEDDYINPVGHSKSMGGRLNEVGCREVRLATGAGGHGWGMSEAERYEWMKSFRRPEAPARVRIKTADLRHGTAYWANIDSIDDRMKMALLDVKRDSDRRTDRFDIAAADNVARFTVRRMSPSARVAYLGAAVDLPDPVPEKITLEKAGDAFRFAQDAPAGLRKRKGMEGPIHDAFREPFLVVVGTVSPDEFERQVVRAEAERWRRQWRRRFQAWPPVKDDRDVTDTDIAAKNLILFGGPQANSVTARVNARLPARIEGRAVVVGDRRYEGDDLGLKLAYPNPLNPDRLVVLQASTTWRGMWQMTHRFGNWFDWMPLENRDWFDFCVFDDRSAEFETFLDVGFFDEAWGLEKANRWQAAPEWREKAAPRNYPKFREVPAEGDVSLSDLWPSQVDTAKGPLQLDRSFNGRGLCIGSEPQRRGLGQWIESAIVYDLDGRFDRFETNFGIDAEGQEVISAARRDTEATTFQVLSETRMLAEVRSVRFGDAPGRLSVDVTGVRRLTLRTLRQTPQGWLYGPICWGEPVLRMGKPAPENDKR
jgi:dienelactone hydrolase